jgi:hypothetical protein
MNIQTFDLKTNRDLFNSPRQPGIFVFYKESKAKKKAIILHVCELSKYFPKAPLMVRKISFLFYFAEDKPNETEIDELINKYYHNITVLQKYSKYKDFCDIVDFTFNGCPAENPPENSEKSNYTFLWIFLFASAAVLFIVSGMSCKQCLEPKRNRIEPKPTRNRISTKPKPKNDRTQTKPKQTRFKPRLFSRTEPESDHKNANEPESGSENLNQTEF